MNACLAGGGLLGVLVAAVAAPVSAQPGVRTIPAPGGEVVIADERAAVAYDSYHYAPIRRAGDYVYVSGVVIARAERGTPTPDSFKAAARVGFQRIGALLASEHLTFADVVMINSFHDWTAPEFAGDRLAQFEAFGAVKGEFVVAPYPAWTAVGTSGLISERGIVEVQVIAYLPARGGRR